MIRQVPKTGSLGAEAQPAHDIIRITSAIRDLSIDMTVLIPPLTPAAAAGRPVLPARIRGIIAAWRAVGARVGVGLSRRHALS